MQPDKPGAVALDVGGEAPNAIPLWDGGVRVGTHVLTRLSVSCLSYLSANPGSSGTQVCRGLGVRHLSQVSRLLSRLEAKGLVANDRLRRENAWTLTPLGRRVLNESQPVWTEQAVDRDTVTLAARVRRVSAGPMTERRESKSSASIPA